MTGTEMSAGKKKKNVLIKKASVLSFWIFKKMISFLLFLYNTLLIFLNTAKELRKKKKILTANS